MKTIKEKAEEYSFIRQGTEPSGIQYRDFSINKKDGFEEGANYVLEEIERIVNSAIENKSMTIPTWRLNYIIKQLKK